MSIFDRKYLLGGQQGAQATADLNFLTGTLDPRITFSRADATANASYTDATGVMRYGPNNLMFPSNAPATLFTAVRSVLTAASGTAPDGTNTMARMAETAVTNYQYAAKVNTVTAATVYTFSLYAQAQQTQYLQLLYDDGTLVNGCYATFDLTNGIISGPLTARGTGTAVAASIQAVGGGMYRISVSGTSNSTTGRCIVFLSNSGNPGFPPTYTGNASNGFLIWGAQLEANTALGPYVATTAAAASGPRFDYDPVTRVPRGLLIEEARTNLLFPSDMSAGWTLTNTTTTAASGTAPDGTVTLNRVAETAVTAAHFINKNALVTASAIYTISLFAKAQQNQYLQLNFDDGTNGAYATFDLLAGTITGPLTAKGTGTANGASIQAVGNGVYRCTLSASHGSTTGRMLVCLSNVANPVVAPSYPGNTANGLLVWGAQLEAGVFPTSYIPTVGATVTRAADTWTMPTSGWYNAATTTACFAIEGLMLQATATGTNSSWMALDDTTANNRLTFHQGSAVARIATILASGGVTSVNQSGVSLNPTTPAIFKFAIQSSNSIATWGAASIGFSTATSAPLPLAPTRISGFAGTNPINGYLRRVRYWAQPLSLSQLISVTK